MTKFIVGKRNIEIALEMHNSGVSVGFKIGRLSNQDKRALGYATTTDLAIRQDGAKSELVEVTNGYTGFIACATAQ